MKLLNQIILFFLLSCLAPCAEAARKYIVPEQPFVGSYCSDGKDNDNDGLYDASDSKCSATDTFSTCTGGLCANVKDAILAGYTTTSDTNAAGGAYVRHPSTTPFEKAQMALCHNFTAGQTGTYYLWLSYKSFDTTNNLVYISFDSPFTSTPPSSAATVLPTVQLNYGFPSTYVFLASDILNRVNGTTPFTFNVPSAGNHCLFIQSSPNIRFDAVYLSTDSGATPTTAGAVTQPVAYEIQKYQPNGYAEPTSCSDSIWTYANKVPFSGFKSNGYALNPNFKVVWNGTNKIYGCLSVDDPTITSAYSGRDTSAIFGDDYSQVNLKWNTSTAIDTSTIGIILNPNTTALDSTHGGVYDYQGTSGGTYDLGWNGVTTKTVTTVSNTSWSVFFVATLPATITADTIGLGNFLNYQQSGLLEFDAFNASGNVNNIANWGRVKFSSAGVPPPPADTTPPTVSSCSCSSITVSGATCSCTVADSQSGVNSCQLAYGTASDGNNSANYGNYPNTINITPTTSGGTTTCSGTITNQSDSTVIYYTMRATDNAGNNGYSTEGNFTTATPTNTIYISPSGNDSTGDGSSTNPYKTFAKVIPMLQPGYTLILKDGTYTKSTTGLLIVGNSTSAKSGTASNHIIVKAQNERQAFIKSDGTLPAIYVHNGIGYWDFNGLRVESVDLDIASGGGQYPVVQVGASATDTANHITFSKLLCAHNNRYFNVACFQSSYSDSVVVKDSEAYYFHRHGFSHYHATNSFFVRDYVNSRHYGDLKVDSSGHCNDSWKGSDATQAAGTGPLASSVQSQHAQTTCGVGQCISSTAPATCKTCATGDICGYDSRIVDRGDEGLICYSSNGCTIINSISEENDQISVGRNGDTSPINRLFGSISMGENSGLDNFSATTATADISNGNIYENDVAINGSTGLFENSVKNAIARNITLYNNTTGMSASHFGSLSDTAIAGQSFTITNILSFNNSGSEFTVNNATYPAASAVMQNCSNGGGTTSGSFTASNLFNSAPTGMGTGTNQCIVYVPGGSDGCAGYTNPLVNGIASNMVGKGLNIGVGVDIGANIVHRYKDDGSGLDCTQKLWNQTTGQFPCGATVAGLNDDPNGSTTATQACINVHKRLNVGVNGCTIP